MKIRPNRTRYIRFLAYALPVLFATSAWAQADGKAMLRIVCDAEGANAEVTINGQFRGECPVDMSVAAGTLKIVVTKKLDESRQRVFAQDIRVAADSVKRVEVVLGPVQLNAQAQLRADVEARQRAERERVEQAEREQRRQEVAARQVAAQAARQAQEEEQARQGMICFAHIQVLSDPSRKQWVTRVWQNSNPDKTEAIQRETLEKFANAMHAAQPDLWHDFSAEKTVCNGPFCHRAVLRHLFGNSQMAFQFCGIDPNVIQRTQLEKRAKGEASDWLPEGAKPLP